MINDKVINYEIRQSNNSDPNKSNNNTINYKFIYIL
jgi:hypothetical protein